jgi:hypothetical protein
MLCRLGCAVLPLLVWGVSAGLVVGEEPSGDAPVASTPTADAEAIQEWVNQLDSDSFDVREAATLSLERAGEPAIELLTRASRGQNLEVSSRSIRILMAIFRSGNVRASEAAELALEQLAAAENGWTARRAAMGLLSQDAIRQKRAIARIEELGGTITRVETLRGNNGEYIERINLTKDWKGGDAGLALVKRITTLRTLYVVKGANVTPGGLDDLQKSAPNLRIEHRGEAMLGVAGAPWQGGKGCQIAMISEDSAAERAGLEVGDVIVKFKGAEVNQFDDIIAFTMQCKAGETVILEVLREGESLRKPVTLREWK